MVGRPLIIRRSVLIVWGRTVIIRRSLARTIIVWRPLIGWAVVVGPLIVRSHLILIAGTITASAGVISAGLGRYWFPVAVAIADIRVVSFRIATIVPIITRIAGLRHVIIRFGYIVRIWINGRVIEEPAAVCPPPPSAAAMPAAMPPAPMSPLKALTRREPIDVPPQARAERIGANRYPAGEAAGPNAGRHTMKTVHMHADTEVRPISRSDMHSGMIIRWIGQRRRRKCGCEQKPAKYIANVLH